MSHGTSPSTSPVLLLAAGIASGVAFGLASARTRTDGGAVEPPTRQRAEQRAELNQRDIAERGGNAAQDTAPLILQPFAPLEGNPTNSCDAGEAPAIDEDFSE